MLAFTKQTDYGLMALHYLATRFEGDCATNAKTIAQACALPSELLAKTMQLLAKKGLVESKNGPKGGYVLAKEPDSITIAEVVRAIEGPIAITSCQITDVHDCEQYRNCSIFHPMEQLQGRITELLELLDESSIIETNLSKLSIFIFLLDPILVKCSFYYMRL